MAPVSPQDLPRFIDHTLLRPDATSQDITQLCAEAKVHGFYAVCIHGCWIELARHLLNQTPVKVASVVGFPLGANDTDVKRFETEAAIDAGAHEIDVVLNIGRLKEDPDDRFLLRELRDIVEAADERPVKVILETSLLSLQQKIRACHLVVEAGAHFVKTSTGFLGGGATIEDVRLLREQVGPEFGVKASGGIRDTATALAMIAAGANRLGTSSGVAIMSGVAPVPGTY